MKRNNLTQSPSPAARPSGAHAPFSLSCTSGTKGGRARPWLHDAAWIAPVAVGWAIAFGCAAIAPDPAAGDFWQTPALLAVLAVALIAYGVGWKVRDEMRRPFDRGAGERIER